MELQLLSPACSPMRTWQRSFAGSRSSSIVMLTIANLLWSGQGVAVKLLAGHLQPLAIALLPFYALAPAGLILLPMSVPRKNFLSRAWHSRYQLLLAGTGGQLLAQVGMTLGVSRSLASNGAILSMLIPVLSAILAVQLLGERFTYLRVSSLSLGIVGALLLSWNFLGTTIATGHSTGLRELEGNSLIAAGCLGSAFYNVYSKSLLERFSEFEILFFSYLGAALCGLPMLVFFAPHCIANLAGLRMPSWLALSYLAFGLYGLSMVLFLRALRRLDAVFASTSLYLVPLFGVVLGVTVLHEHLGLQAIAGSAIVLLSALLLFRFDVSFKPVQQAK